MLPGISNIAITSLNLQNFNFPTVVLVSLCLTSLKITVYMSHKQSIEHANNHRCIMLVNLLEEKLAKQHKLKKHWSISAQNNSIV